MTLFDKLYFTIFEFYKNRKFKSASSIGIFYVTFVQAVAILFLGLFFAEFFKNMNIETLDENKAWTLFILLIVFLYFKNWIQYSGKKRVVLKAKFKSEKPLDQSIYLLWVVPLVLLIMAIALLRVLKY